MSPRSGSPLRTTVVAVAITILLSFFLIVSYMSRATPLSAASAGGAQGSHADARDGSVRGSSVDVIARQLVDSLPRQAGSASGLSHLIVVPCHGMVRGANFQAYKSDEAWAFEPFQLGHNMPDTLASHIRKALALGVDDRSAVVIFSGGQSRVDGAARSEGQSYMDIAVANGFHGIAELMGSTSNTRNDDEAQVAPVRRVFAEEYARDSYENLLFSIARFYEVTGQYPARVTVVGFSYKERRFTDLHRHAIRFPVSKFDYVGIDELPSPGAARTREPLSDAKTMARVRGDLYGCGEVSMRTRRKRNPNRRVPPYALTVTPEVRALLLYCGPGLFDGPLPWALSRL